jgi:hypothetical protein
MKLRFEVLMAVTIEVYYHLPYNLVDIHRSF